MSDLIHQAHKAKILAVDASLPKWQRLCQGLEAFSGFELSSLAEDVARQIEADLVRVNEVMAGYRLADIRDYARFRHTPGRATRGQSALFRCLSVNGVPGGRSFSGDPRSILAARRVAV